MLGDFNTHHPWWDPLANPTQGADQLVEWLDDYKLELVNTPGEGTFFRPNLARLSVLDLAFTTSTLTSRIKEWQILPDLGSDHFGILFTIIGTKIELVSNPTQLAHFNTDKANWDLFASSLQSNIANSRVANSQEYTTILDTDYSTQLLQNDDLPITQLLNAVATEVTTAITRAVKSSIPTTT